MYTVISRSLVVWEFLSNLSGDTLVRGQSAKARTCVRGWLTEHLKFGFLKEKTIIICWNPNCKLNIRLLNAKTFYKLTRLHRCWKRNVLVTVLAFLVTNINIQRLSPTSWCQRNHCHHISLVDSQLLTTPGSQWRWRLKVGDDLWMLVT